LISAPTDPVLSSLRVSAWQRRGHRGLYRRGGTKYITLRQATGLIEAVGFARSIGLPLVAHLTIHWSLTDVGDDPNGKLFAKTREGFHKWLGRRGIVFAAAWVRERQSGGRSDVEHCHLLFHLRQITAPVGGCFKLRLLLVVWSAFMVAASFMRRPLT
jgi:hypothetical protein